MKHANILAMTQFLYTRIYTENSAISDLNTVGVRRCVLGVKIEDF